MSEFQKVTKLSDRAGTRAVNFSNGFNINGSDSGISSFTHTEGATEPSSPSNGDTWWDSDHDIYKVYMNNEWKDWLGTTVSGISWGGDRGVFAGGFTNSGHIDVIQYVTIASTGNTTDFGDLSASRDRGSGLSNSTRGIVGNGLNSSFADVNIIEYVTIASTGNATDFGDSTDARSFCACCQSTTRGIWGGGPGLNVIDYVTIASTGNATDFGDLDTGIEQLGGLSNSTRGLFGGGSTSGGYVNVIQYITIASTGNSTDFGDLQASVVQKQGTANATRGLFAGGYSGSARINVIDQVEIATTGNATDFGDLTEVRNQGFQGMVSAAHGGIA